MTVLHDAIERYDWPAVLARLATHAGEAAIADHHDADGALPLHLAALHGAPLEVMQALLDAHPAAASTRDENGDLPLHWAAFHEGCADVVELLLRAYPEAAYLTSIYGCLPLHDATLEELEGYPAPLEVVVALLAAYPEAALVRTNNGRLPNLSRYSAPDIRAALAAASSARRAPALLAWHRLRA